MEFIVLYSFCARHTLSNIAEPLYGQNEHFMAQNDHNVAHSAFGHKSINVGLRQLFRGHN